MKDLEDTMKETDWDGVGAGDIMREMRAKLEPPLALAMKVGLRRR